VDLKTNKSQKNCFFKGSGCSKLKKTAPKELQDNVLHSHVFIERIQACCFQKAENVKMNFKSFAKKISAFQFFFQKKRKNSATKNIYCQTKTAECNDLREKFKITISQTLLID
jgi:hypothetical protein